MANAVAYVSDVNRRMECFLSKFVDDTEAGGIDKPEGCAAIKWDDDTLAIWADRNLLSRGNGNIKSCTLGMKNHI